MQLHKKKGSFAGVQEPSDAVTDAWVRLIRAERGIVGKIEAELKGRMGA